MRIAISVKYVLLSSFILTIATAFTVTTGTPNLFSKVGKPFNINNERSRFNNNFGKNRKENSGPPTMMKMVGSADVAMDMIEQAASLYGYCLDAYHWPTQLTTAGICAALGDVLAQVTSDDNEEYNPERTFKFFLKGVGGGVMWDYWYTMADQVSLDVTNALTPEAFKTMSSSSNDFLQAGTEEFVAFDSDNPVTRVVMSIVLEQIFVAPLFYTFWDIPVPALLNGSPVRQMPAQVQAKLVPLLWANFKVWTPMNIITYTLPAEFRLLFASFADLIWQTFNSKITSQDIVIPAKLQSVATTVSAGDSSMNALSENESSTRLSTVGTVATDD